MSLLNIYIIALVIATLIMFVLYVMGQIEHKKELQKIRDLEAQTKKNNDELQKIRSRTTACPVPNLNTPRSCYFDSGYSCSWNIDEKRCDEL